MTDSSRSSSLAFLPGTLLAGGVLLSLSLPAAGRSPGSSGTPQEGDAAQAEAGPGAQEPATGGLKRVPTPERIQGRAFSGDEAFDPNVWLDRLATRDLDEREVHFDALADLARSDPQVREFLEELAAEPVATELAWTARLLLRELRQDPPRDLLFGWRGNPPQVPGTGSLPFLDPFEMLRSGAGPRDLDELLRGMLPGGHLALPDGQGAHSSTRGMRIEQTDEGWRIVLDEVVDGERTTREFTGKSLEDILEANPELEGRLRVPGHGPGAHFQLELGPELFQRGLLPFGDPNGLERRGFVLRAPSQPVSTDKLGVMVAPLSAVDAARLGLQEGTGLRVGSTYPGTIADLLGVEAGSVLLELNDVPLAAASDITRLLHERAPDQSVTLVWLDGTGGRHQRTWDPAKPRRLTKDF